MPSPHTPHPQRRTDNDSVNTMASQTPATSLPRPSGSRDATAPAAAAHHTQVPSAATGSGFTPSPGPAPTPLQHTIGRIRSAESLRSSTSTASSTSTSGSQYHTATRKDSWLARVQGGSGATARFVRRRIPLLCWLVSDPGYNWKGDLTQDLFAGVSISVVIIPQSMAYAMLASLPPVHGLYTSLVPTVVYAILGTSKHMSTGAFAITSLLLGQSVHKILVDSGYSDDTGPEGEYHRRYLPLCLLLTFFVGGVQILLSMARLGRVISKHLLPIALVSGFNTASAFHIGTHQLNHLLGLNPPRESRVFGMIRTWIWVIQHLWNETVWPSFVMGLAAMALMYLLQRIEYYRRSRSNLLLGSSSSPALSPPLTSPSLPFCSPMSLRHSATFSPTIDRTLSQDHHRKHPDTNSSRRPLRNIVPKAVSDQSLLTAQDVALENSDEELDGIAACCSPRNAVSEASDEIEPLPGATPNTPLSSSSSGRPANSARSHRPTINTSSTRATQAQLQSPISPGMAGLTNTGAIGHRQERTRSSKPSSTPRTRNYKSFRSPPTSQNRHHALMDFSEEQEPLLSTTATANPDRPTSTPTFGPAASTSARYGAIGDGDDHGARSSCSSEDYDGNGRHPTSRPEHGLRVNDGEVTSLQGRYGLPQWLPRVHFPIPDIFICVVLFTAANVIFGLDQLYPIAVVGPIPTGLPNMSWPPTMMGPWSVHDWTPLIWPGILMAVVVYVMSLSVAKHFGREYGYEVKADQEMLALGVGSLVGSCFGAYACTGNLTRSAILAQLGAKTPLASIVGALMVLMSLLWFTVVFERVPNTILAAIVLVALKSLMSHTVEAKRLWRAGRRREALVWWITFTSVMVFSIEIGLAVGMATVVSLKLYKNGPRWRKAFVRSLKQSATYQRVMLMLGLQSPLFTTVGRGDDEDDY
ncbi:unnamed protein product [Mortierella alpina]